MTTKQEQNGDDQILRKGPWMPEEDEILVEYVHQYGPRDWSSIRSKGLLPRTGKSCRLRWVNKLKPDLKRSGCKFSPEEEKLVVEMQEKLGNKWAKIASYLPGRTDNDVKNFWSTRQKRLLRAMQRPRQSGNVESGADHQHDLGRHQCFNEFAAFQGLQSSPSSSALLHSGLGNTFPFGDEKDLMFAGQQGGLVSELGKLRHPFAALHAGDAGEDVFMVKLQDLVVNESFFVDSSDHVSTRLTDHAGEELNSSKQGLGMASAAAGGGNSRSATRSMLKRRPRSKRDIQCRNGFETISHDQQLQQQQQVQPHTPTNFSYMNNSSITNNDSNNLYVSMENFMMQAGCMDVGFGGLPTVTPSSCACSFFSSSSSSSASSSSCSSASSSSSMMLNRQSWEKMPLLFGDQEPTCHDLITAAILPDLSCCVKEEVDMATDSCTPDTVLIPYANDLGGLDSLESLSPSSSDWWESR